jgi:hypothetical protein
MLGGRGEGRGGEGGGGGGGRGDQQVQRGVAGEHRPVAERRGDGQGRAVRGGRDDARAGDLAAGSFDHYMIQPLVELYGGCMVVLKIS